jgi:L-lactate dehydrogenase complex protein LldF
VSLPLDRRASLLLSTPSQVERHDRGVYSLRERRDAAVRELPEFEALRDHAARLRAHVLDHLGEYLERFEERATAHGLRVHWAPDTAAHNQIVHGILAARGVRRVVKSKSITTEECGLNAHLEGRGLEVIDTDLGERIVQLRREPPSHILAPAIHTTREEIGELFHRELEAHPPPETDPERLVRHARVDLRPRFLAAEAALNGVNFAVAETGSLVIVTNEGNADLGMGLAPLQVVSMGIEKVVAGVADLAVLLRLLARSATGQALSVYTSVVNSPRPGQEIHVVLLDNGRSRLLASPAHRSALRCIRCGACLNTCPVYRRAGGHAYAQTIPGPIGAVLAPALGRGADRKTLPHASTLCGSCTAVCPVKIDLHHQLLLWREELWRPGLGERILVRAAGFALRHGRVYRGLTRLARAIWPRLSRRWRWNPARPWLAGRELPEHPGRSFAEQMAARAARREVR